MTGWEAVLRGFEDALRERLPAKLAEVSSRYNDTVVVREPRAWFRHAEETNNDWPAVYIVPGEEARSEKQTGGWTDAVYPTVVAVEFDGDNPGDMATALLRYATAVLEVVIRAPYPEPAHYVGWRSTIPGDVFQAGAGATFRSWVELTFDVKVFEEHLS